MRHRNHLAFIEKGREEFRLRQRLCSRFLGFGTPLIASRSACANDLGELNIALSGKFPLAKRTRLNKS
jgi:hypothetical protein